MQIISDAQLLAQIEAFLKKHEMPPTRFGREAMGDGALVSQLRAQNRSLSLKNATSWSIPHHMPGRAVGTIATVCWGRDVGR